MPTGGGKSADCATLNVDVSDLLHDLDQAATPPVDDVPPHMKTMNELVEASGMGQNSVARRVRKAVDSGRWVMQRYRIETGSRGVYPTPHYGPAEPPEGSKP